MADVPDAVACPPSQSVSSRRQMARGDDGARERDAFAAATAAAREAREPPAMRTSQGGSARRSTARKGGRRTWESRVGSRQKSVTSERERKRERERERERT
jgi:hypothetical protein